MGAVLCSCGTQTRTNPVNHNYLIATANQHYIHRGAMCVSYLVGIRENSSGTTAGLDRRLREIPHEYEHHSGHKQKMPFLRLFFSWEIQVAKCWVRASRQDIELLLDLLVELFPMVQAHDLKLSGCFHTIFVQCESQRIAVLSP